jgi:hypothetical protein
VELAAEECYPEKEFLLRVPPTDDQCLDSEMPSKLFASKSLFLKMSIFAIFLFLSSVTGLPNNAPPLKANQLGKQKQQYG